MANIFYTDDILLAAVIAVVMVLVSFLIHYEALYWISRCMPRINLVHGRFRMMIVVMGIFAAHTVEIWAYALCYYVLSLYGAGNLEGVVNTSNGFLEYLYFSTVTYSSLGLGEIFPTGTFRLLAGVEALNGLVLIGWSASFTYLYMEKFWSFPKK